MKVLLVYAHTAGDSLLADSMDYLRELFAEKGIDTDLFRIENSQLRGCVACGKCWRAGKCIFDDEVNEVISQMQKCDALLIGSEVLYGKPDEQTVRFLERLFHAGTDVLARKPASALLTNRHRSSSSAFLEICDFFSKANMPVAAVQTGHVIHAEEGSHEVLSAIVSQLVWLMRCVEAGKKNGVDFSEGAPKRILDHVR
jgi:multimeric flavodoxin WrbA